MDDNGLVPVSLRREATIETGAVLRLALGDDVTKSAGDVTIRGQGMDARLLRRGSVAAGSGD